MKTQCPHCGKKVGICISTSKKNSNGQKMVRWAVVPTETGLAAMIIPREGEDVFACIPPFKITTLHPPPYGHNVISQPNQYFTASTIWESSEEGKYRKEFIKLLEENKIFCVGKIDKDLKVKIDNKGKKWLAEMELKYMWR